MNKPYTAYVIRNTERRQYLDTSKAGNHWGPFFASSVYDNRQAADRISANINSSAGRDLSQVVSVRFTK